MKLAIMAFSIGFFLILPMAVFSAGEQVKQDSSSSGYGLADADNNGITDAFENAPADTSVRNQDSLGRPVDVKQRMRHATDHGGHGKELDRGESPHAH